MPSFDENLMRSIIMDHYQNPRNHSLTDDKDYKSVNMDSETCIDNIDVQAKFNDGKIEDVRYDGEACAICTASTSIMTELLKGKSIPEAKKIIENYENMIYERDYDPELLDEAIAFMNTHNQANRIKCATLGWTGMKALIDEEEKNNDK
ncbi:MAG: SUF system NifU family Fe-S cluster assembly protein [Thomasclavelia sp.]|jgi:nitrogen fixation NifU-like protein|nr:SUF system NifU family Fe-S cluster assembly protein [Thomasclavelia sp.]